MEFYERVSGARMHAAYVRPGGVSMVSTQSSLRIIFHRYLFIGLYLYLCRIKIYRYVVSAGTSMRVGRDTCMHPGA